MSRQPRRRYRVVISGGGVTSLIGAGLHERAAVDLAARTAASTVDHYVKHGGVAHRTEAPAGGTLIEIVGPDFRFRRDVLVEPD